MNSVLASSVIDHWFELDQVKPKTIKLCCFSAKHVA